MGLTARRILPLTFVVNLFLNITFLIYTDTLRLPRFPGFNQPQTETNTDPAWAAKPAKPPLDPVAFAMVMYGESSAEEGLLALKTALMHVSRPTEFHIVCSSDAIPILQDKLDLFSRPAYSVSVKYYPISEESIRDRANRAGVASKYSAGYGGLVKTFLHEVLYDVKRVIFFDTDMLFQVDPYLLWRDFERDWDLDKDLMVAWPTLGEHSTSQQVCTCVMLLDLEQMRKHLFMSSTSFPDGTVTLGNNETWAEVGMDPESPDFGDQGLYWAIWKRHGQGTFADLSVSWDMTYCRYSYGLSLADGDDSMIESEQVGKQVWTEEADVYGKWLQLYPALLHFNCLNMDVVWNHPAAYERARWAPFVAVAKQYKWVWLNRGDGTAAVYTETVEERPFWDELAFEEGVLRLNP